MSTETTESIEISINAFGAIVERQTKAQERQAKALERMADALQEQNRVLKARLKTHDDVRYEQIFLKREVDALEKISVSLDVIASAKRAKRSSKSRR